MSSLRVKSSVSSTLSCWNVCRSVVSRRWRRLRLRTLPVGVKTLYDRGCTSVDITLAGCQVSVWVSLTRTSCPGISGASGCIARLSWLRRWISCHSARRRLISSFDQCSFLMITGRFDLYLRAFSISAGDGKWLSIGVDLKASSAFCGLDLDIAAFFRVYFTVWTWRSLNPFDCGKCGLDVTWSKHHSAAKFRKTWLL